MSERLEAERLRVAAGGRRSPVLVQSSLLAALSALLVAVGDLVVNFGSHFVLQLHDVLKGHVGKFWG